MTERPQSRTIRQAERDTIHVALFNFKNGGLVGEGRYNFERLGRAFSAVENPPGLIVLCEAKKWGRDGRTPLYTAAGVLSEELGRPYVAELGWINRGDFPPAVLYDPTQLRIKYWGDPSEPDDKRNLAGFELSEGKETLLVSAQHLNPRSGDERLEEAKVLGSYGDRKDPVLIAGDFNSTPSGPHYPQRDWESLPYRKRTDKGRQRADGTWVADTRSVDHLTGPWEETGRGDGCGFLLVNELAFATGTPPEEAFRPTTTGSGMVIDLFVANKALADRYVPGSYKVHVSEDNPPPSEHSLVVASFNFAGRERSE